MDKTKKEGNCDHCKRKMTVKRSEFIFKCNQCQCMNIFPCHVMKSDEKTEGEVQCKTCNRKMIFLNCSKCKGYFGITKYKFGHTYACPCGYIFTLLCCGQCSALLALPPGKNYKNTEIKCKQCEYKFKYIFCLTCEQIVLKNAENEEHYICKNPMCKENPSPKRRMDAQSTDICKYCHKEAVMMNLSCYHVSLCQECLAKGSKVGERLKCPICSAIGQYQRLNN